MEACNLDGIINIYKEKGYTSHDVVAKLRGILHMKRIGHTGTLDPDAEGVLPVCIGRATSLCEYLTDKNKEYEAVVHLGIITDTLDMSGNIIERNNPVCTKAQIEDVLTHFTGEIMQVPPMYSAIKVNGKKLYELARKGKEVERKPRKVTINSLKLISFDEQDMKFRIRADVSKGTYIRSLCDDIGCMLGCGACMGELTRTRSGIYKIEDSVTLGELSDMAGNEIEGMLQSIESTFMMPGKICCPEADRLVVNGNQVKADKLKDYGHNTEKAYINTGKDDICVYLSDGSFAALYRYERDTHIYKPLKMFVSA